MNEDFDIVSVFIALLFSIDDFLHFDSQHETGLHLETFQEVHLICLKVLDESTL